MEKVECRNIFREIINKQVVTMHGKNLKSDFGSLQSIKRMTSRRK
jgi:hypothetical protein